MGKVVALKLSTEFWEMNYEKIVKIFFVLLEIPIKLKFLLLI